MPPKKKTKKLIKLKKRVPATTINIKIDNSRRTQARKPAENKPKGHVNLPITYFSQFQPARTVITEQRPNQGFNTTDMYQSQFKNYFDGKLNDMEKRILEQSEKKNTAPPKPEMAKPGAYSRVSDYDDNLIMENRKPKAPPPNRTNIISNSNLEDLEPVGTIRPVGFANVVDELKFKFSNITEAEPANQPQTTTIAEAQQLTPKSLIKSMSRVERNEAQKIKQDIDKEESIEDAKNTYMKLTKQLGIEPKTYSRASDYSRQSGILADKIYQKKVLGILKSHKDPDVAYINKMNRNIANVDKMVEGSNKTIRNLRSQTIQESKTIPQSKRYNLRLPKT